MTEDEHDRQDALEEASTAAAAVPDAEPAERAAAVPDAEPAEPAEPLDPRRAEINFKQGLLAGLLAELGCEAALLLMPAHVAWFTGGLVTRGLIADVERPGIYTNGRQRWLVCSSIDSQRLFDEELDGMGFMLKEWPWTVGRGTLLGDLVIGKKVACDRPYPTMPMINDRLRPHLRPLLLRDATRYQELGRLLAHALEATARSVQPGQSEEEIAGQLAHRLYHRGAEAAGLSVTVDERGRKFRRSGFTAAPLRRLCTLQATATRQGLFATAARTVCLGPPEPGERAEFDAAVRVAAVYRSWSVPEASLSLAVDTAANLLKGTPYEHEWRLSQPGYAAGWFPADELRRAGQEEKFVRDQPLVWQARIGSRAVVDTVLVGPNGAVAITPPTGWPYKRVHLNNQDYDIPDVLIRPVS